MQRALEDAGLDRHVQVLPLYGELAAAAQDAALTAAAAGRAENRAGDQHRGDQPDHRGHSGRR